jgi:hypothetical protein
MWNSRKVGEWIERRSGKMVSQKKQRGWEYLKKLKQSPKVPRPHHASADNHEQEAFRNVIMALPGHPEAMKMDPSPR